MKIESFFSDEKMGLWLKYEQIKYFRCCFTIAVYFLPKF